MFWDARSFVARHTQQAEEEEASGEQADEQPGERGVVGGREHGAVHGRDPAEHVVRHAVAVDRAAGHRAPQALRLLWRE